MGTSRFAGNYSIFKSQQVKQMRLTEGLELNRNYSVVSRGRMFH